MIAIPTVHTIWCDDIRREVANKFSCMGIYHGDAVFTEMPATVAKLSAVVSVAVEVGKIPSQISATIVRSDGSTITQVLADLSIQDRPPIPDGRTHAHFFFIFEINMLQLTKDDRYLMASVLIDDIEYLGPELWLVTTPSPETESLEGAQN